MGYKQLYGQTFHSKREFFKWIEENEDRLIGMKMLNLGGIIKKMRRMNSYGFR